MKHKEKMLYDTGNGNKGKLQIPQNPKLESHHQMQFNIITIGYNHWLNPDSSTPQLLNSHLPPISQTIKVRWRRRAGEC